MEILKPARLVWHQQLLPHSVRGCEHYQKLLAAIYMILSIALLLHDWLITQLHECPGVQAFPNQVFSECTFLVRKINVWQKLSEACHMNYLSTVIPVFRGGHGLKIRDKWMPIAFFFPFF